MRAGVIIAGVLAVGLAAVVFINMNKEAPAPATGPVAAAPEVKSINIYVAAQAIPVGTVVTQEMLAIQPWPENLKLDSFVPSDQGAKDIVGFVTRGPFQAQEPIIKSKLANPSDPNFLAGELPKGMRVVSIITNETEGVAGFLFPGDHVDVMLTHDVDRVRANPASHGEAQTDKEAITETLLTNVKVMAVDQRAAGATATDSEGKLIVPRSISLMVSQSDAQRLRLGEKMGTLTVSLRSLADRDSADPLTLTKSSDVSQNKLGGVLEEAPTGDVKIYRGAPKDSSDAPSGSQGGGGMAMPSSMGAAAPATQPQPFVGHQ